MPHATGSTETQQETAVRVERHGHVLLMGLNRPAKRNAFNLAMIDQLAALCRHTLASRKMIENTASSTITQKIDSTTERVVS